MDERPPTGISPLHRSAINNRTKALDGLKSPSLKNGDSGDDSRQLINIYNRKLQLSPRGDAPAVRMADTDSDGNTTPTSNGKPFIRDNLPYDADKLKIGDEEGITLIFNTNRSKLGLELNPAKQYPSLRSLKQQHQAEELPGLTRTGSAVFSDSGSQYSKFPDALSMRSLASIGMGSTDGRRMVIRRVPTSPNELLNLVNPPT